MIQISHIPLLLQNISLANFLWPWTLKFDIQILDVSSTKASKNYFKILAFKKIFLGQVFGIVTKIPLGILASHIVVPGFKSQLLANTHPGGQQWWLEYLGLCGAHGRLGLNCRLLALAWLRISKDLFIYVSPCFLSLCLWNKMKII